MERNNTLGVIGNTALSKCWGAELAQLDGAYSENTIRAYRADYAHFETWCAVRQILPMPASAEVIAEYITALSDQRAPATIRRRLVGISRVHQLCGAPDVAKSHVIRLALRRILRARGQRQKQVLGLRAELRDRLLQASGTGLRGARDRALISVGYDTLCRRSELVALRVEDVSSSADGSGSVLVRRSKVDQTGHGRLAYLSVASVERLENWLRSSGVMDGPIFRAVRGEKISKRRLNSYAVTQIVKRLGRDAALPEEIVARLSGHSFRIGAALDMTESGIDLVPIMQAGGWKSPEMVVRYTAQIKLIHSGMALLASKRREVR